MIKMKQGYDSRKGITVLLAGATVCAVIAGIAVQVHRSKRAKNQGHQSTSTPAVQQQDFAHVARVYKRDGSNELVLNIDDIWFKYVSPRNAENSEGGLSPITRQMQRTYGVPLLEQVISHAYSNGYPKVNQPIFALTSTAPLSPQTIADQYTQVAMYATMDPRSNVVHDLSKPTDTK